MNRAENQLQLFTKEHHVRADEVLKLLGVLAGEDWMQARVISNVTAWKDRKIRAIANASNGQIISGQLGYKLTAAATLTEIEHAVNWLRHQSREMNIRATQIERVRHGKARVA